MSVNHNAFKKSSSLALAYKLECLL